MVNFRVSFWGSKNPEQEGWEFTDWLKHLREQKSEEWEEQQLPVEESLEDWVEKKSQTWVRVKSEN